MVIINSDSDHWYSIFVSHFISSNIVVVAEIYSKAVLVINSIQPLALMMESAHLEDPHTGFFYFVANKQVTDLTQNYFYLMAEHSGFVKHLKTNSIVLSNAIFPQNKQRNKLCQQQINK